MSITCKTGCGQQVVYENIEFTDGFAYQCPHNLDDSLHYCPIFYDHSSLFTGPGGGMAFDANPFRENSYGSEIEKFGQIFYEFEELVMTKNKNLSVEDINIYKTRLQSFLNAFPINGLYTDATDGLQAYDKQGFENALESGAVNSRHYEYYKSYMDHEDSAINNISFTLSSSPITALKKIYYILEGDSVNFKKCQQFEKEIKENAPKWITSYEENPFELKLIEAQKQLKIFQDKLKNNVEVKNKENTIKDIIQYYHELINGIKTPLDEWDTRKHVFNGLGSDGIKDEIKNWYDNKKIYLKFKTLSEKLKISYEEAQTLSYHHWDYFDNEEKKKWLNRINADEKSKIINSTYQELESSFPNLVKELLEFGIFGSESSRQIVNSTKKGVTQSSEFSIVSLFNIHKIRELIFKNAQNNVQEIMEEFLTTDNEEISSNISLEFEERKPLEYNFNSHLNQNSMIHLSNAEKHLRKLIINEIYDCDVNFLKKHFKQIWMDIENTKSRDGKNIQKPREETVLDYATFGQLLDILKNKESKNRVKIKKLDSHENLIQKIEIILPYRNQLSHNRGTIDGDLDINSKAIVVGLCNEIDEFCSRILHR